MVISVQSRGSGSRAVLVLVGTRDHPLDCLSWSDYSVTSRAGSADPTMKLVAIYISEWVLDYFPDTIENYVLFPDGHP